MKKSLAAQIAHNIKLDHIEGANLRPGDRLPTIRELQQQYGASMTTVAHALGQLEAQGIVRKRQGQGCFVEEPPVENTTHTVDTIGLIVGKLSMPEIAARLFEGIERSCQRHGCRSVLSMSYLTYEAERERVAQMVDDGVQAAIIYPAERNLEQLNSDYLNTEFKDFPMILIDTAYPQQEHTRIVFDNYRAGYEMTRLLADRGHTHIGFMRMATKGGLQTAPAVRERYRGYLSALREAGLPHNAADIWEVSGKVMRDGASLRAELVSHLKAWRDAPERPTAMIALHDGVAVATTDAANEFDISMPDELQVAGFDNLSIGQSTWPPFPTTSTDFTLAGEMAVDLVVRQLRGDLHNPGTYVLPEPIIERFAPGTDDKSKK